MTIQRTTNKFPSPYWGLFFYRSIETGRINKLKLNRFPSPYWGLFFYHTRAVKLPNYGTKKFPSPYWGLFFYRQQYHLPLRLLDFLGFRPHIGDYFFISKLKILE